VVGTLLLRGGWLVITRESGACAWLSCPMSEDREGWANPTTEAGVCAQEFRSTHAALWGEHASDAAPPSPTSPEPSADAAATSAPPDAAAAPPPPTPPEPAADAAAPSAP